MSKKKGKTNAVRMLEQQKIPFTMSEYEWTEETLNAVITAERLAIPSAQLFKTLVLVGTQTGPIVAVIPGNETLDLKKLAKVSHNKKVEMLHMKDLEPLTGYVHGGCSPIGMKKHFPTFFDDSLLSLDEVHVSGGKRGLQIGIAPKDLLNLSRGTTASLTN